MQQALAVKVKLLRPLAFLCIGDDAWKCVDSIKYLKLTLSMSWKWSLCPWRPSIIFPTRWRSLPNGMFSKFFNVKAWILNGSLLMFTTHLMEEINLDCMAIDVPFCSRPDLCWYQRQHCRWRLLLHSQREWSLFELHVSQRWTGDVCGCSVWAAPGVSAVSQGPQGVLQIYLFRPR